MRTQISLLLALLFVLLLPPVGFAATVGSDGGITLWVSWDDLDGATPADIDDIITEADSIADPDAYSCGPTNEGRSAVGAANSPPSCPATGSCSGRQKVTGDLEKLADYIWEASEGSHYLRRAYVSDKGRSWNYADVTWNMGVGGSAAAGGGWSDPSKKMRMQSAFRTCLHDVLHHELGHYFYNLPDRYAQEIAAIPDESYYKGRFGSDPEFPVAVTQRDINTVMSKNFPHLFVDTTNASITVSYTEPGQPAVAGEVLTPSLLTDGIPNNDGPDRAHHNFTDPFAQDEWSLLPSRHADMTGVHEEGTFTDPADAPALDIVFIDGDAASPPPGTILLLDRSGSMSAVTDGIQAVQFVQEAGMFLYHSSEPTDRVGTLVYNAAVEELFPYALYDAANDLPFASFKNATGATNIASALEMAIDELIDFHGEADVPGAEIYLLSDGVQTVGDDLFDEVDRANQRGIRVHTLSFGNADADTMQAIAGNSGGSNTLMSELEDAAELKMLMTRTFEVGRGRTPLVVFKDPIPENGRSRVGGRETYTTAFWVPSDSRDIQFYIFSPTGNPAIDLSVRLISPAGLTYDSPAPDHVAQLGRFNGVRVDAPELGKWHYQLISTGADLPSDEIEIAGYALNGRLDTSVGFKGPEGGQVQILAQAYLRYPLTDVPAMANIFHEGDLVAQLALTDAGDPGIDDQPLDGVYSGVLDLASPSDARLALALTRGATKLRVEVEFSVVRGVARPAPAAHYEAGTSHAALEAEFAQAHRTDFSAWASGVTSTSDPENPRDPYILTSLTPAGASFNRGATTSFDLAVSGARPLASQVRVSLGQGVHVDLFPQPAGSSGDLQTRVTAFVTVDEDAVLGGRSLAVQFGDQVLRWTGLIEIFPASATSVPALKKFSLLLLILSMTVGTFVWARRRAVQS